VRQLIWIFVVLLAYSSSVAATKEDERPDKEMLGLMEFLRDIEMIKNLELMRQMDSLERMEQPSTKQSTDKQPPAKTKVR
jgi:hypothetical protein